jgi:hypothetical protein
MKIAFAILGAALFLTVNASAAGTDYIIKQHAKELRDQNNVRQGVPPTTQAPQPGAANQTQTPAPAPSPGVGKLKTDLAAIKAGSTVTTEQKQQLTRDIMEVAQGAKPASATAAKLAEDLAAAFVEKPLSATSLSRFVQELDAVFNPGKFPQAKPEGIFADVQAIFQEGGEVRKKAIVISDGVKAIAGEIQRGGVK